MQYLRRFGGGGGISNDNRYLAQGLGKAKEGGWGWGWDGIHTLVFGRMGAGEKRANDSSG